MEFLFSLLDPTLLCKRSLSDSRLFAALAPVARCVAHRIRLVGCDTSVVSSSGAMSADAGGGRRIGGGAGVAADRPQPGRPRDALHANVPCSLRQWKEGEVEGEDPGGSERLERSALGGEGYEGWAAEDRRRMEVRRS